MERGQLLDVGDDEVLALEPTQRVDAGDTLDALYLWRDDPVLDGMEVGRLVRLADEAVAFGGDIAPVWL